MCVCRVIVDSFTTLLSCFSDIDLYIVKLTATEMNMAMWMLGLPGDKEGKCTAPRIVGIGTH